MSIWAPSGLTVVTNGSEVENEIGRGEEELDVWRGVLGVDSPDPSSIDYVFGLMESCRDGDNFFACENFEKSLDGLEKMRENESDFTSHLFKPTPCMPPYILGLWVFPSSFLVPHSEEIIPPSCVDCPPLTLTSYHHPSAPSDVLISHRMARDALWFFSTLFQAPFAMEELQQIPVRWMHGLGMENYGACSYAADYFLASHTSTPFTINRRIQRLICHEVLHQWFGNLVSPSCFGELWLNEGMARFFEYIALDSLRPHLDCWTDFLVNVFERAMKADSNVRSSHPIVQDHGNDIESIMASFDTITYGKSGSLLRMVHHHIGHPKFVRGMRAYVRDHNLQTATREDLWEAFDEQEREEKKDTEENKDVEVIDPLPLRYVLDPWLTRSYFPIVSVEMRQTDSSLCITMTQSPSCHTQTSFQLDSTLNTDPSSSDFSSHMSEVGITLEELSPRISSGGGEGWVRDHLWGFRSGDCRAVQTIEEVEEGVLSDYAKGEKEGTWPIPLTIGIMTSQRGRTNIPLLLTKKQTTLTLEIGDSDLVQGVVMNSNHSAFVRMVYVNDLAYDLVIGACMCDPNQNYLSSISSICGSSSKEVDDSVFSEPHITSSEFHSPCMLAPSPQEASQVERIGLVLDLTSTFSTSPPLSRLFSEEFLGGDISQPSYFLGIAKALATESTEIWMGLSLSDHESNVRKMENIIQIQQSLADLAASMGREDVREVDYGVEISDSSEIDPMASRVHEGMGQLVSLVDGWETFMEATLGENNTKEPEKEATV